MSRFGSLGAALAMTAALTASGPATAALTTRSGTFKLTVTIVSDANIPNATMFTVRATVGARGADYSQSEAAQRQVAKTSGSQVVTITVPYLWKLDQPLVSTATISVSVSAALASPLSNSANRSFSTPLPANGATTPLAATIRL
ncbi:hypothetical protein [Methylosinus sp. Sm6]|uniref:hypothetical protein n=1 Tax=Methylosinus sp. Sm6 TaxID=2866948 RepID=UPI001C990B33|nr:hypothetical protein [Methylosinus sp. Sm6]MBY6243194.1 hypothetical protein [Methylosinus sp. Sm6]